MKNLFLFITEFILKYAGASMAAVAFFAPFRAFSNPSAGLGVVLWSLTIEICIYGIMSYGLWSLGTKVGKI